MSASELHHPRPRSRGFSTVVPARLRLTAANSAGLRRVHERSGLHRSRFGSRRGRKRTVLCAGHNVGVSFGSRIRLIVGRCGGPWWRGCLGGGPSGDLIRNQLVVQTGATSGSRSGCTPKRLKAPFGAFIVGPVVPVANRAAGRKAWRAPKRPLAVSGALDRPFFVAVRQRGVDGSGRT